MINPFPALLAALALGASLEGGYKPPRRARRRCTNRPRRLRRKAERQARKRGRR